MRPAPATLGGVLAGLALAAAPADAVSRPGRYAGRGVSFVVVRHRVDNFKIRLVYVCGPTGGEHFGFTLKLSGAALDARGVFRLHFEQGPLVVDAKGRVSGSRASGSAEGFGDVGTGSSDCGTGTVRWTARYR